MFTYGKGGVGRVDNRPRRGVELSQAITRTVSSRPPSPSQGPYHPQRRRTHVQHQPPCCHTVVVVVINRSLPGDIDRVGPFAGGALERQGHYLPVGRPLTSGYMVRWGMSPKCAPGAAVTPPGAVGLSGTALAGTTQPALRNRCSQRFARHGSRLRVHVDVRKYGGLQVMAAKLRRPRHLLNQSQFEDRLRQGSSYLSLLRRPVAWSSLWRRIPLRCVVKDCSPATCHPATKVGSRVDWPPDSSAVPSPPCECSDRPRVSASCRARSPGESRGPPPSRCGVAGAV